MQPNNDWLDTWEDIVDQVDKEHIPLECVKKIIFKFRGSGQKTINLQKMKSNGLNIEEISQVVDRYVQENSLSISNMEFILDVKAVAEILQPETDKLLKGI